MQQSPQQKSFKEILSFKKLRLANVNCPHENEKQMFSDSSGVRSPFVMGCVASRPNERNNKAAF